MFDDTLRTALSVALRQSPFLNVLSDDKVAATFQLMTRPANTKLTPDLARELCQRSDSNVYIAGSIASLGSEYVLGLKAVNCQSGDTLAQEQVTATAKEKVLDALGEAAAKLRGELGESLSTVQKFDVPLYQATTSSLESLKAYSLASDTDSAAALRNNLRAIQLDPNFAIAYLAAGSNYGSMAQLGRCNEYYTKAFELRQHASELERLLIAAAYYDIVTGELDKAAQTYQEGTESYPRSAWGHIGLGRVLAKQGNYEKAATETRQGLRLDPDSLTGYPNTGMYLLALQRFDEATQITREGQAHKLDDLETHNLLYALAFLRLEPRGLGEQQQWFASNREYDAFGLSLASDTEAYAGHSARSLELTKQGVASSIRVDSKETAAVWQENAALREAAFGNYRQGQQLAAEGLKLDPEGQSVGVRAEAALAFAMVGDTARAQSLAQDLNRRSPLDTQVQDLWLPASQAQLALNRKNPTEAVSRLQASVPIELGGFEFVNNISCLYHVYERGEAYLAAGHGDTAATEFQKILDHSGIVWNCWTGALAHLGVARANALQSRTSHGADADAARARALAAYRDFLTLWKDADPGIPILKQAEAEYAKLQ